jgi:hypothetical protein
MKKTLLAIAVVAAGFSVSAQVDTLTSHFIGNPTVYVPDQVNPQDSGYVSGTNAYGDLAKMQLFDATYGVTSGGTITAVLLGLPIKVDNGGSFQVAIWGDNAGQPANPLTPLATVNVTLASVDTAVTSFNVATGSVFYNFVATFSTAVTIPAGNKFWAGIVLPTGTNELALYSSNLTTNPFADAITHTGEFWVDGSFQTFGDVDNWGADIALAIFPVVDLVASVEENVIEASVYPNPANDVLNIKVGNEEIATVSIVSMDGKVVATSTNGTVNIADITAGMYMYQVTTVAGKLANGNFTKK